MTNDHGPMTPSSVQPGGGWIVRLELAWGRLRRAWLRCCRPAYARAQTAKRQGDCPDCPHDIIDSRDLKFTRNVCGYWFRPEEDRFRWRDHTGLAREGLAEVVVFTLLFFLLSTALVLLAVLVHWLFWLPQLAAVVVWAEIIYFFRDPERTPPDDPTALLSPADGTVTHVEEVDEPDFTGGRALRISIFLSIFNVHINRVPRCGRVVAVRYFPGAFLDARHAECATRNEQLWIDLEEPATGRRIRVKQISGAIARRIVCRLKPGEAVSAGARFGMIKLGSRTDVLVPAAECSELKVKVGDKVHGGTTILLHVRSD